MHRDKNNGASKPCLSVANFVFLNDERNSGHLLVMTPRCRKLNAVSVEKVRDAELIAAA